MDTQTVAVKRALAAAGISIPSTSVREVPWSGLLDTRNSLNRFVTQTLDAGGAATPEAIDAAEFATEVLAGIKGEMDRRDATGSRAARSESVGQLIDATPSVPGRIADANTSMAPTGPLWAQMFPAARRDTGGFASFGSFAAAVLNRDPRLFQNAAGMSEGVGADGGFFVPGAFLTATMDGSLQAEAIRPRAAVFPVESSPVQIPTFSTENRVANVAGLNPELRGEGQTGSPQKATTKNITMQLHKQMVLVPTTAELLEDAPGVFGALLQNYMIAALSAKLDDMFINGTGAGQPLGILSAPCTVSVAKEGSQVAATLVPENVAKMLGPFGAGLVRQGDLAGAFQCRSAAVPARGQGQERRRHRKRRRIRTLVV